MPIICTSIKVGIKTEFMTKFQYAISFDHLVPSPPPPFLVLESKFYVFSLLLDMGAWVFFNILNGK